VLSSPEPLPDGVFAPRNSPGKLKRDRFSSLTRLLYASTLKRILPPHISAATFAPTPPSAAARWFDSGCAEG
jgi:hypothetical protein